MEKVRRIASLVLAKKYRRWITVAVLLLTSTLVIHFFTSHPEYLARLRTVSPVVILLVVFLNIPAMASLAWAYDAMLKLCGKTIDTKENLLLTAYSSLANFFGPLQSGPGVRMVYLKARHKVHMRDFLMATLIYYSLFASFSAFFLFVGMRPWWQTLLALVGAIGCSTVVIWFFSQRRTARSDSQASQFHMKRGPLIALALAVFLQLTFIVAYYFVELHAVNPRIQLNQAISYAGAANFSLFVSVTPDAVGFREAFLVFSQQIHHVSTADILNANIIDRGSYAIFLSLLALFTLATHARDRLHLKSIV